MISALVMAASAAAAIALSAAIVQQVKRLAPLDVPNERSSHSTPTARGGGIAIVILTAAGALLLTVSTHLVVYLAAGLFIAIVSWIDDVKRLPPAIRFVAQLAAAAAVIAAYGPLDSLQLGGSFYLRLAPWFAAVLTALWIVGLTNAFNFMDGIDGIAGGQTVVAGAAWLAIAFLHGDVHLAAVALLLAASAIGFLLHNWPPASIFMGDVGSAFLGFSFATLPLLESPRRPVTAVVALLVMFPFLMDTLFTLIRRARRGERLWQAHRSHLYQRLVIAGWSHRRVTLLYMGAAAVDSAAALLFDRGVPGSGAIAVVALLATAGAIVSLTLAAERRNVL